MRGWRTGSGIKLRTKLLLLLPLLMTIPYMGYQYVRAMEDLLRSGLEDSVLETARVLAASLHGEQALFRTTSKNNTSKTTDVVYAHPLPEPIELDGYTSDWGRHQLEMRPISPALGGDAQASYVAGSRDGYLYVLISVVDDKVVYRNSQMPFARDCDQVLLSIRNKAGDVERYLITTRSPGAATTFKVPGRTTHEPPQIEVRIRAQWQPTKSGYAVEVRAPLGMIGPELGLRVLDVDVQDTAIADDEFGAARLHPRRLPLLLPSAEIGAFLQRLGRLRGRRVWVVDSGRRVLARGGTLESDEGIGLDINPFYGLILRPPSGALFVEPPVLSRLDGIDVTAALDGKPLTRWRATDERGLWIVSGGFPVRAESAIVGAVIVEQTSLGVQTLTHKALAELFNMTLMICAAGAFVLLLFASRIVARLRRLSSQADAAIDDHGRVVGTLSRNHGNDEIGELASSFANMIDRLREYNAYLENLARRLSHELRTPLAIVRSSVDSLMGHPDNEPTTVYAERAQEGLTRLDTIISRMSEAARLEQALAASEKERFDLCAVLSTTVEAYRSIWLDHEFELRGCEDTVMIEGVPDLVVEMVDKLVSNAVELGTQERPIELELGRDNDRVVLFVINYGSLLPVSMQEQLFESMVSVREQKRGTTPHLGLGLYIARIIADFHEASIAAENLATEDGVVFRVSFRGV